MTPFEIEIVWPTKHMVALADYLLRNPIVCDSDALRIDIRRLLKSYIDEADELHQYNEDLLAGRVVRLDFRSPQEMYERAQRLTTVWLEDADTERHVRLIATAYLSMASQNGEAFSDFKKKYGFYPTELRPLGE